MEKKRKEMAEDYKTAQDRLQEIQQQVIRAEETKISEARKASEMEGKCKNCSEELAEAKSRLQTLKEEVNLLLESKFSERKLLEKVADEYKKIMGKTEKVKKEFNEVEVKHKSEIFHLEQQYQEIQTKITKAKEKLCCITEEVAKNEAKHQELRKAINEINSQESLKNKIGNFDAINAEIEAAREELDQINKGISHAGNFRKMVTHKNMQDEFDILDADIKK
eukprot:TRINITY_DN684_c0_g1_i1.p1 TRINITY_DN684_c0_g1~~TRINITY_DN684_c0_g1_i1.p1  ORF type:complete len:222 (-),score=52.12 TRINITY_DN684_c0_g1_i1:313-978(-)